MKAPHEEYTSRGAFVMVTLLVACADYGPLATRHLSQTLFVP
jgi:hypothetical protein